MLGLAKKHNHPVWLAPRVERRVLSGGPPRLAQATPPARSIKVVVTDIRGRAVPGADVSAWSSGSPLAAGTSDSSGEVTLSLGPGTYDLRTVFGSQAYTLWSKASSDDVARGATFFVQVPICSSQPLLTTPEIATLVTAALVTGAGYYFDCDPVKVTGEVLLGAAIFTAIYRMSCL